MSFARDEGDEVMTSECEAPSSPGMLALERLPLSPSKLALDRRRDGLLIQRELTSGATRSFPATATSARDAALLASSPHHFITPHGLHSPICQRAPEPFQRTELEVAQPERAPDELSGADRRDDVVQLVALQFAVPCESRAGEQEERDHALRHVVRERHPADGREHLRRARKPLSATQQHDRGEMSECQR